MGCPVDSEQLDSFIDGEAEPKFSEWFTPHVKECPGCQSRLEFHKSLRRLVRQDVEKEKVPDLTRMRLLKALEVSASGRVPDAEKKPRRSMMGRRWMRPALAAASLLLLSTVALHEIATVQPHPMALAMVTDHVQCTEQDQHPGGPSLSPTPAEVAQFPQLSPYAMKVCPIGGQPALHVLYHDNNQTKVSMYEMQAPEFGKQLQEATDSIHPTLLSARENNVAAWKHRGWVYSLVSNMPGDQLEQIASKGSFTAMTSPAQMLAQPSRGSLPSGIPSFAPAPGQAAFGPGGVEAQPASYEQR